jgi:hypothetical protein
MESASSACGLFDNAQNIAEAKLPDSKNGSVSRFWIDLAKLAKGYGSNCHETGLRTSHHGEKLLG